MIRCKSDRSSSNESNCSTEELESPVLLLLFCNGDVENAAGGTSGGGTAAADAAREADEATDMDIEVVELLALGFEDTAGPPLAAYGLVVLVVVEHSAVVVVVVVVMDMLAVLVDMVAWLLGGGSLLCGYRCCCC